MYIAPNSIVRLLKGVTIDPTHENTIYFETQSAQTAYFVSKVKYTFERVSYQRANKGVVKVERNAESLYDCNYIMFQNLAFGNKWFYGFVTDVEYINDTTAAVYYELDDIQTWFFDFSLNQCFVEREHASTDVPGDNLVPENLETGELLTVKQYTAHLASANDGWVVVATFDKNGNDAVGTIYQGLFSGLKYNLFDDFAELSTWLSSQIVSAKQDGIIGVYQIPQKMYNALEISPTFVPGEFVEIDDQTKNFDGYVPRNKKLLTYPYSYLHVTNLNGSAVDLHFEQWRTAGKKGLEIQFAMSTTPTIIAYPTNYMFVNENEPGLTTNREFEHQIVLNNLPMCPYVTDSFKAWIAQNVGGIASSLGAPTTAVALTAAGMGAASMAVPAVGLGLAVANTLASAATHAIAPPTAHGQQGGVSNLQFGFIDFFFKEVQLQRQFAEIIDSYFDRFGYATKKTKTPNRSIRPHWNYLKTIGCTISGTIPADAERRICEIHDRGITYWKNGDEVGNYSLNNSIS